MIERSPSYDALIVGGGLIGLACAWRAAREGASVRVLERDRPGAGASGVAAGMLAPAGEADFGEDALLSLGLASLERWEAFAAGLEADSGAPAGYRRCGALHVALDRDEAEALRRERELQDRLGLETEWLRPSACRALEPALAPALRGGVHVPGEAVADPILACEALLGALGALGVPVDSGAEVVAAELSGSGCELRVADGRVLAARRVVLATGAWAGSHEWLAREARPPVRPVKGEILTLRGEAADPVCERIVAGERVYLVPREDGRLVVGATVEERGFDTAVTAGGVHELLREAYRVIPEIAELEFAETRAGLRPGTPDNAPIVGPAAAEGLIVAGGHHRNGVLLAPVTADAVAALLAGRSPDVDLAPFDPARFAAARSPREEARA